MAVFVVLLSVVPLVPLVLVLVVIVIVMVLVIVLAMAIPVAMVPFLAVVAFVFCS